MDTVYRTRRKARLEAAGDTFKAAESLLTDRKGGKEPEKVSNHTFSGACSESIGHGWRAVKKSAKTKGYIIGQLFSFFGDIPLSKFSTALVDQLQTDLISKGYTPAYNNKVTNVLKHMFNKALEWEMITEDDLKACPQGKALER